MPAEALVAETQREEGAVPISALAHKLDCFQRYLSLWVGLMMIAGAAIGALAPVIPEKLNEATFFDISLPVAILVWLMIFPMTLKIDFASIRYITRHPRSLVVTLFCNWAFQPFLMYGLAKLFFGVIYSSVLDETTQAQYIAGSVILGGSPCTAMVFVWSSMVGGHAAYTFIQVAINDLLLMVLYVPTLYLLLDLSDVEIPYVTIILAVVVFVAVPFLLGAVVRWWLLRKCTAAAGAERLQALDRLFSPVTMFGLLATVLLTFIFQGPTIQSSWVDILLIAVPLTVQTYIAFTVAFGTLYVLGVEWIIAAPAGFISSSNFFELGIAIAMSSCGIGSGAALATTVGVLTEVPVMLSLVYITVALRPRFCKRDKQRQDEEQRRHCCSTRKTLSKSTSSVHARTQYTGHLYLDCNWAIYTVPVHENTIICVNEHINVWPLPSFFPCLDECCAVVLSLLMCATLLFIVMGRIRQSTKLWCYVALSANLQCQGTSALVRMTVMFAMK
ncbi:sodium bile acid symporter family-domain-containing protein [Tribonema minus]|uniref:Sodium bile acid symporter family-domain-containing protein n=1 Tax=Tribonema minus TaxID=303371 RepID=A0A836CI42_9STRA|nr:sodium bile acid symporter family-domain-containing protein [Tribonema minus]